MVGGGVFAVDAGRRDAAVVYACACVWDEPPPRTPAKVKAGDQGRLTTLRNTLTPTSNGHSSTTPSTLQYMLVASSISGLA